MNSGTRPRGTQLSLRVSVEENIGGRVSHTAWLEPLLSCGALWMEWVFISTALVRCRCAEGPAVSMTLLSHTDSATVGENPWITPAGESNSLPLVERHGHYTHEPLGSCQVSSKLFQRPLQTFPSPAILPGGLHFFCNNSLKWAVSFSSFYRFLEAEKFAETHI